MKTAVPALLAHAVRVGSAEVEAREAAVTAARAALDAARREHNADAAVAEWIGYRAAAGALPQEDREALLTGGFTRRLLTRGLIRRNSALWREHVPTDAGKHVAHLLRGNPPPPAVVMRAAWRVWLAIGFRGNAANAYDAWNAGATAEQAAAEAARIERTLQSPLSEPDAATIAFWRALMGEAKP